jgi:hypothetical protein
MTFQPRDASVIYLTNQHKNLISRLHQALSDPVDSYWNGSHTWFSHIGETDIEWRLHPVEGFSMPEASRPEELFELAIEGSIDITHYWEGLEVYCFDETDLTPDDIASYVSDMIGIEPDYRGYVDHASIGDEFERKGGKVSIIELVVAQITS